MKEAQRQIDSREFVEWIAYLNVESEDPKVPPRQSIEEMETVLEGIVRTHEVLGRGNNRNTGG